MGLNSKVVDLAGFGRRGYPASLAREYPFKLRGIVMDDDEDGDNVRVILDQALGDRTEAVVRIAGHSSAESRSRDPFERWLGLRAKTARKAILHPNRPVGIISMKLEEDFSINFARILGYVEFDQGGTVVDVSEYLTGGASVPGCWPSSLWKKEGIPPWAKDQWWALYEEEMKP